MSSTKSQIEQYLKNGNSITPAVAAEQFNCYCLAAVILKLRKKGITILSEKIEGTQSKRYWIENEQ